MKNFFQKNWWIAVVAILVVAVLVVVLLTAKQNPPTGEPKTEATTAATTAATIAENTEETTVATEPQQTEATVEATEETTAVVRMEILDYEFTISAQLAERISCREIVDSEVLDVEVYTKLGDKEYTVFTMIFNFTEGDIVHMLNTAEGEKVPIAFVMKELPEGLSDEAASEFYIAQGVVNEIIGSIKAK